MRQSGAAHSQLPRLPRRLLLMHRLLAMHQSGELVGGVLLLNARGVQAAVVALRQFGLRSLRRLLLQLPLHLVDLLLRLFALDAVAELLRAVRRDVVAAHEAPFVVHHRLPAVRDAVRRVVGVLVVRGHRQQRKLSCRWRLRRWHRAERWDIRVVPEVGGLVQVGLELCAVGRNRRDGRQKRMDAHGLPKG